MLEVEINEVRDTEKFEIENVDLFVRMFIIEVSEKKLECEKLKRFRFIIGDSDRNRISREAEGFDGVELKLGDRDLELAKLFLYEVIVESKRFMACLSLAEKMCHSSGYDDRENETTLIFFWIGLAAVGRSLLTMISWIDFLVEKRKSNLWKLLSVCR